MKDELYIFLIEPFKERSLQGFFAGIFLWGILFSSIYGLFYLVDSAFLPIKEKQGVITEKYYTTWHYGCKFIVKANIDNLTDDVSLNYSVWENVEENQVYLFDYSEGRLFNTIYVKTIYLKSAE